MATLHQATLEPSKPALLAAYLPTVEGLGIAEGDELTPLGAYRFDDPADEVGIETHLIATADGRTVHMPLTYRAGPLAGADDWFVGTLEHSALGTRWVYNGSGDPVYVAELTRTILEGGTQVKLEILTPDGRVERENTVHVKGSGPLSTAADDADSVNVLHVVSPGPMPSDPYLTGTWPGNDHPTVLATLRR